MQKKNYINLFKAVINFYFESVFIEKAIKWKDR